MRSLVCLLFVALAVAVVGEDYYSLLGLSRSASSSEIKRSFRSASRTKHPDKGGSKEEWVKINRAYEVLSDAEKRRVYDQHGEEGLKRMEGGQGGGGGDPFSSIFDFFGGGGRQQGGVPRGPDLDLPLVVSLRDLYLGREIRAAHRKQQLCSHCRGSGAEHPEDVSVCKQCQGKGVVVKMQQLGPGFYTQMQQPCSACSGKGKVVTSTCHQCSGHKVETGEEVLTIRVERGMRQGQKITFSGAGDESADLQPGDISFVIVEASHPTFSRDGDDLHTTLTISLLEALTGFHKEIEHLDGRKIVVERSDITIPGQIITVSQEGMPIPEYSSEKGDLFVKIHVEFPKTLTEQQKTDLKKLLA